MMDEAPEEMKRHARVLMAKAIRSGDLRRGPCEKCGTTEHIHGHHTDYTQPLKVMWLCDSHHTQIHMTGKKYDKIEGLQVASCYKCKSSWAIRKKGGGKKCPRCQAKRK